MHHTKFTEVTKVFWEAGKSPNVFKHYGRIRAIPDADSAPKAFVPFATSV
jgi:hypothetical protein